MRTWLTLGHTGRALTRIIGPRSAAFILLCLNLSFSSSSLAEVSESSAKEEQSEELNWEFSFGTTQLFEGWFGESELNLPVSSATLMLARELGDYLSLWAIFNLPLVPSQELLADGSTRLTRSAPVFLLGASVALFTTPLSRANRLSADLGLYGGKVLRGEGPYFPLSALRLKILKGADTTLYLGLSASVGVDTLGLLYGVGHRF